MTAKLRKPASNTIPGRPIVMKARYRGRCRCGKPIRVGDVIYYDPHSRRHSQCQPCGRRDSQLAKQLLVQESPVTKEQYVIDRVNQLRMLPAPRSKPIEIELAILMRRLQTDLLHSREAEVFWLNLARITFPTADLILKDNKIRTSCANCHTRLSIGLRVLYCRNSQKHLCLVCQPKEFKKQQSIWG